MESLWILGTMTGTSCDGIDASLIEFDPAGWRPGPTYSKPYPAKLRQRVLDFQKPNSRFCSQEWLELNRDLGIWFADVLSEILSEIPEDQRPQVVANHGQTVAHFPPPKKRDPLRPRLGTSLQLGDPAIIADRTGLSVISQFRNGDLAAQGQGAPLVPLYHRILADQLLDRGEKKSSAAGMSIHNIGGMSNLTFFDRSGAITAFDTGPGNIWIDAAAKKATRGKQIMDIDGKLAMQGEVDLKAVQRVLRNSYFKLPAPKSTGRDQFPDQLFFKATRAQGSDLVATATAITIESIARAYESLEQTRRTKLREIWVCGGGARNPSLLKGLCARLGGKPVRSLAEVGWDPQAIESQAFAFYGYLTLRGQSLTGSWTGARADFIVPGQITPGKNWREVLTALENLGILPR